MSKYIIFFVIIILLFLFLPTFLIGMFTLIGIATCYNFLKKYVDK